MSFTIAPNYNESGILDRLCHEQKSVYDPLYVASTSSCDPYNLLDPDTRDIFYTTGNHEYFEFELENPITINGVKIYSFSQFFPRSFDIKIDGEIVASIKDAKELNGKNQMMKVEIEPRECHKIRIITTGPNWDKGAKNVIYKRVELTSPDAKYKKGVFATLLQEHEGNDPHRCGVHIAASNFDFNSFVSVEAKYCIITVPEDDSWFQVELTKGSATVDAIRLRRCNPGKLKSFKIIATDDVNKTTDQWVKLCEVNEQSEEKTPLVEVYKFDKSPSVKFIRLIQTGPNFENQLSLKFLHFDIFGTYTP